MGRRANLFVIDDPIGSHEQASSPVYREKASRWFASTAKTRLLEDSSIVLSGTSWHVDDLFHRQLAAQGSGGDQWELIKFPAIAHEGCLLDRSPGEALWASRYPLEWLESTKAAFEAEGQSRYWYALYDCTPLMGEGDTEWPAEYFDDIWVESLPRSEVGLRVLALDPAKGKSKSGCFQALAEMNVTKFGTIVCRSWLERLPVPALEDLVCHLLRSGSWDGFVCEANAMQHVIATNIWNKSSKRINFYLKDSYVHKSTRIKLGLGPLLAQSRLKLHTDSPSNRLLLDQLKSFPSGAFVDGPDALCLAWDLVDSLLTGEEKPGLTLRAA